MGPYSICADSWQAAAPIYQVPYNEPDGSGVPINSVGVLAQATALRETQETNDKRQVNGSQPKLRHLGCSRDHKNSERTADIQRTANRLRRSAARKDGREDSASKPPAVGAHFTKKRHICTHIHIHTCPCAI